MRGFRLAVLAAALGVACGGDDPTQPTNTGNQNTPNNPSNPSNPTPTASNAVSVIDGAFNPSAITVAPGSTVTWTWTTSTTHNVTFNDSGITGSGNLSSGTFQKAFATAGTFGYQCTLHAGMTGTVTVQ